MSQPASPAKLTLDNASPDELKAFIRKVEVRRRQIEAKLKGESGSLLTPPSPNLTRSCASPRGDGGPQSLV